MVKSKPNNRFHNVSKENQVQMPKLDLHRVDHKRARVFIHNFLLLVKDGHTEGLVITGNSPIMRTILFEECKNTEMYPHFPFNGSNNYGSFVVRKDPLSFWGLVTEDDQRRMGGAL